MTNAVVLLILGAVVFVAFAVVCILVLPERLVKRDTGGRELDSPEQLASAKNAVRTTLVQAIVGLAALTGIAVAWQQLKADQTQLQVERNQLQEQLNLTRQGQVADRFTRAVDQLGSGKFDVQLGGIYALERIANEAKDPKDRTRLVVFEVLTAYVRRHSPRQDPECPPEGPNGYLQELPNRAADVQAAMTVLARGWVQGDPQLDLHEVDLRGAKLTGIDDL